VTSSLPLFLFMKVCFLL